MGDNVALQLKEKTKEAFSLPQSAKARLNLLVERMASQHIKEEKPREAKLKPNPLRAKLRKAFSR